MITTLMCSIQEIEKVRFSLFAVIKTQGSLSLQSTVKSKDKWEIKDASNWLTLWKEEI
jgi:hypothetical protein